MVLLIKVSAIMMTNLKKKKGWREKRKMGKIGRKKKKKENGEKKENLKKEGKWKNEMTWHT